MLDCETYEGLRQRMWTRLDSLFSYPVRTWSEERKLNVLLGGGECKKMGNYNEVIKCVLEFIKPAMNMRKRIEERTTKEGIFIK